MRTLFGVVLGALLTVGAAYFHDNNVTYDAANPRITDRPIVNWEVAGAVMRQATDWIGGRWNSITGK